MHELKSQVSGKGKDEIERMGQRAEISFYAISF